MDIKGNTMKPTYSFKAKTSRYSLISFPIEKCIYCAAVLIFLWVISSPSSAQTLTKGVSIENTSAIFVEGTKRSALPIAERIKQLNEKKNPLIKPSPLKKITRAQVIASKSKAKMLGELNQRSYYYDFAFYSGYSTLLNDDDGDGFYSTFSVSFDADIISPDPYQQVDVYAEIYLSQNGGPWLHLHTTDVFALYADSTDDEYEVVTQLTANYEPDHYNVLIDLYEAGYTNIAATYSSDDTNSLYALPLESRDWEYDDHNHQAHHGGTYSTIFIFFLFATLCLKFSNQRNRTKNLYNL